MLYSAWSRLWGSHVRLTHEDKDTFIFQATTLFTEGYGKNKTPFELKGLDGTVHPRAEFVVEGKKVVGFGLFGAVREGISRGNEGGVKERADAWFERVDTSVPSSCTIS